MRIQESTTIRRPPDEVFAFFDDRRNDGRWMASVIESEWLDPDTATAVGRRGRAVMKTFGQREYLDEVTEYEPGRRVAHRHEDVSGPLVFQSACHVEPVPEGTRATLVYESERLPGGPLGRLFAPVIWHSVRRSYRADLARLKRLLEDEHVGHDPRASGHS